MRKNNFVAGLSIVMILVISLIIVTSGCKSVSEPINNASETMLETNKSATDSNGKAVATDSSIKDWERASNKRYNDSIRKIIQDRNMTTVKVGLSEPAQEEYFNQIHGGMFTMMKEIQDLYGLKWEYVFEAATIHADIESQQNALRTWSNQGFHAITICTGADIGAIDSLFGELKEKNNTYAYYFNMPPRLLLQDSSSPINDLTMEARSNIGYDQYLAHYKGVEWVAEVLTLKYGEPRGKIGLVWFPPSLWSMERENGLMAALEKYPNIEIVDKVLGDYTRAGGMKAAEDLLTKDPDIDVLYAENSEMALGASQAAQNRGLKTWNWETKDGLIILGANGTLSECKEIIAGNLTGDISANPVQNGRELIEAIFWDRVLGWQIDKIINTPTEVIDIRNVDTHLGLGEWALSFEYPSGGY